MKGRRKTVKRFAKLLLVTVGFGTLGFVMSRVPQKNATGAGGAPVNIVSPLPLPMTGNVNATVNGTVAALQSGNWNVGITGTPTVKCTLFSRVKTDGTVEDFSLQPGTGLVITDIQSLQSGTAGTLGGLLIEKGCPSVAPIFYQAFVVADTSGEIFVNDHITGGLHFTTLPSLLRIVRGCAEFNRDGIPGKRVEASKSPLRERASF